MRNSTRKALKDLSKFLTDVRYEPPGAVLNTPVGGEGAKDLLLQTHVTATQSVSVIDPAAKVMLRLFGYGGPLEMDLGQLDLVVNGEDLISKIEEAASDALKLTSQQLLGPQGIHQPIFAFTLLANMVADQAMQPEIQRLNTLAQTKDIKGINISGDREWRLHDENLIAAAETGLNSTLTSLAGGFKIVDHTLWMSEMKRIKADSIVASTVKTASPSQPKRDAPTFGYVAFVDPMQAYGRIEAEICGVGNQLIPPMEWSRAIPFLNVQVMSNFESVSVNEDDFETVKLSQMSLEYFLRSGLGFSKAINGISSQRHDLIPEMGVINGEEVQLSENGDPIWRQKGNTRAGMEVFTMPQSLVPVGQIPDAYSHVKDYYTSIDKTRPFMSIENFNVSVTPTRGASSSVRGQLTLTLHDRGRLEQIAALLRPETLSNTEFDIEWGWSHPSAGNAEVANVYGEFINSLKQRQKFTLWQSQYAFTDDGQVKITLSLVAKGVETLNETDSAITGQYEESWKAVNIAYEAMAVARAECNKVENFQRYAGEVAALNGQQMVNTLDLDSTGILISVEQGKELQKWIRAAKSTDGVPELDKLVRMLGKLKKAVEAADRSLQQDLDAKMNVLNKTSYRDWAIYTKGVLPGVTTAAGAGKGDFLYNINSNKSLPKGWTAGKKGSKRHYIPLGAFIQMFVAQPLMASGMYDEVQLVSYTCNLHSGAASGANICALPVDMGNIGGKSFKEILKEQYKTYGGQYPVTRFIQWLISNWVEPQLSACHGFGPGGASFKYDPKAGGLQPTEIATKNLSKVAAKNLRRMYYGSEAKGTKFLPRPTLFSAVKVKLLYEVAPSSKQELLALGVPASSITTIDDLTVLRIHVMDAVAEGAEAVGWIDCLRQGRSTSGATIIPPEDSLTPGMSEVAKSAANWENNRMTTRRVCQLLTAMGVLSPGTAQVKDEKDKQLLKDAKADLIKRYQGELADIEFALQRYRGTGAYHAEVKALNEKKIAIEAALAGTGDEAMEFVMGYRLKSFASKKMIKLCSSMAPNIVYGREGSLVNRLSIKQRSNSKASTTYMMRAMGGTQGQKEHDLSRGVPMRLQAADVSIDMFGNPAMKYMQRFFIDADTNTTIDNLYAVTGIDHKLSAGEYTTSLKMVPLEAYGVFQNLATDVDRITNIIEGLKTADGKRRWMIERNAAREKALLADQVRAASMKGAKTADQFLEIQNQFVQHAANWLCACYVRAFAKYALAYRVMNEWTMTSFYNGPDGDYAPDARGGSGGHLDPTYHSNKARTSYFELESPAAFEGNHYKLKSRISWPRGGPGGWRGLMNHQEIKDGLNIFGWMQELHHSYVPITKKVDRENRNAQGWIRVSVGADQYSHEYAWVPDNVFWASALKDDGSASATESAKSADLEVRHEHTGGRHGSKDSGRGHYIDPDTGKALPFTFIENSPGAYEEWREKNTSWAWVFRYREFFQGVAKEEFEMAMSEARSSLRKTFELSMDKKVVYAWYDNFHAALRTAGMFPNRDMFSEKNLYGFLWMGASGDDSISEDYGVYPDNLYTSRLPTPATITSHVLSIPNDVISGDHGLGAAYALGTGYSQKWIDWETTDEVEGRGQIFGDKMEPAFINQPVKPYVPYTPRNTLPGVENRTGAKWDTHWPYKGGYTLVKSIPGLAASYQGNTFTRIDGTTFEVELGPKGIEKVSKQWIKADFISLKNVGEAAKTRVEIAAQSQNTEHMKKYYPEYSEGLEEAGIEAEETSAE